jgi:type I restriction enzyme S subunit
MGKDWSLVPLGELLTQYKEYIEAPELKIYPKLSVKLYGKGVVLDEPADGALLRMKQHQIAKSGQVILSEIWGKKGAIGFVPPEGDGALCTSHFFLFDVHSNKLEPKYLQLIFTANYLEEQLNTEAKGTTGYAAVRPRHLLAAKIPLPPLEEQRRIVARVEQLAGKIEEARSLRQQASEEVDALVASSLSRIFNHQESDVLPKGWHWRHLSELLINDKEGMITGPFGTLLQKSEIQSEGVPVLGIANVQANCFIPGFSDYVSLWKAEMLSSYKLEADDIVIARSGTVGRSCVVPPGFDRAPIMSTNLIRLRLDKQSFLPDLLCRLFNGSRLIEDHKESECRGSTRSFFTQKILLKLQIPVPPLPEQRHIVAYLDNLQAKVDEMKRLREGSMKEFDALLPSILDKAFKGEL